MFRLITVLCTLIYCKNSEAAKILVVVPTPSISHQVVFRPLTQELARRGHEVTVITTDPIYPKGEATENYTEIDVHEISYGEWRKILENMNNGEKSDIKKDAKDLTYACLRVFEEQGKHPDVRDIIKNRNGTFDLLLVEAWPRFALGFSHVIKVPVIAMSSFGATIGNYDVIGAPTHPILYPLPISPRVYNLTMWEKILNIYLKFSIMHDYWFNQLEEENAVVKRIFGEDTPDLSELQSNVQMLFLNIHPIWEENNPVPPSVIHIGGLHQKSLKELPQDLTKYLDSSKNGVIYVSFGTNVETSVLPVDKVKAMVNAFSELPYDVLFKWNGDELPASAKNIKISKWLPQSDLLRHPKVKLFITQGGLQSTDEAIAAGVPLIGIPMFADQYYNVEKYVHHKIGVALDLSTLEAETLRRAIETVIGDKSLIQLLANALELPGSRTASLAWNTSLVSHGNRAFFWDKMNLCVNLGYPENVVRLRTLMNDQPMSSLERAVWWTEYVLRHGGARHMRSPAANMTLAQYYEIPLVLTVLGVATAVMILSSLVLIKTVKLILRYVRNSGKIKKT